MAFELNDLPYSHDALEAAGMCRETLEFHHDLHHKAYVDNGNKLISGTEYENMALEEIIIKSYNASAIAQSGVFNPITVAYVYSFISGGEVIGLGHEIKF